MRLTRHIAAGALLTAATLALAGCDGRPKGPLAVPQGSALALCVNAASGASWVIRIDEAHARADGLPARIDARRIAWSNPADIGDYELERASGELSITRPSSTGGYVMTYRCAARH
jgi:hypothetical protein